MGVVNVTPDSFSDGGRFLDPRRAVEEAFRQARDGAAIVDVGGESTRPGAEPVPAERETERVLPVVEALRAAGLPAWISVDTTKVEVARRALEAGADMINDISGLRFEPGLAALAAERGVPLVLMHSRGDPRTMQQDPRYTDLLGEVAAELRAALRTAAAHGLPPEGVVLDPGIGFAKTAEQNLALLVRLPELAALGRPLLVGTSRKSFIGRILDLPAEERLEGTLATVVLAAAAGAHMVRVHDVAPAWRALRVADALRAAAESEAHERR